VKLPVSDPNQKSPPKSLFGPGFRKWLHMKRALRLVQEEVHTEKMYVPKIRYKQRQYWLDTIYPESTSCDKSDDNDENDLNAVLLHRDHHPLLERLQNGLDPNTRMGRNERSLLQIASNKGDPEKVDILLEYGASVNDTDRNGDSAMYLAVNKPLFFHKIKILWSLHKGGADVNHPNHQGWTALHRACLLGEPAIIRALLEMGADPYVLNTKNMIPIQYCKVNAEEIVNHFKQSVTKQNRHRHHLMWAHLMSRDFVSALFMAVEPACVICKRKVRKCGSLKKENYRYWLFVHNKKPR